MRTRHVLCFLGLAASLAGAIVGCSLLGSVSIDERIASFQADLNKTDRTSAYLNFHPDLTTDFDTLKSGATIMTIFPLPDGTGTSYTLSITDKSSPSTGVFVTVTGGPTPAFFPPLYLKLVMQTTGTSDYRIVSLEWRNTAVFPGPPQIK